MQKHLSLSECGVVCSARQQFSMGNLGPGIIKQSPAQDVHVLCLVYIEIFLLPVIQLMCIQV